MKTKNFLLPALAVAMFAAPVMAQHYVGGLESYSVSSSGLMKPLADQPSYKMMQDYHEYENEIRDTITQATVENTRQHQYLDLGFLRAVIAEDLSINIDEIRTAAANSIADKQIPLIYQYDIMVLCIENNRNDILRALLEAGFNPEINVELGLISLPAKAVESNNLEAFRMSFTFGDKNKTIQVLDELENLDRALIKRFYEFVKKCESTVGLNKTINKFDKPTLKKFEKLEKPHGEMLMEVKERPAAAVMMMDMPTLVIPMPKSILAPVVSDTTKKELEKKGYTVDTVPAATKTIKVE